MATSSPPTSIKTLADLLDRLGGIPLDRIRFYPYPGTATAEDVLEIHRREGRLFELVEGVLVGKTVGYIESSLAIVLAGFINAFVVPRNLGIVTGADGTMEIMPDLVRIPDVAFTSWDRLPGRQCPVQPIPLLAPSVAVEVLSRSNTPREMAIKREEYFAAGVELVWEVDPRGRTVAVYAPAQAPITLPETGVLEGGTPLPGFRLPLKQLFAELDRHG